MALVSRKKTGPNNVSNRRSRFSEIYKLTELPEPDNRRARFTSLRLANEAAETAFRSGAYGLIKDTSIKNLVFDAMVNQGLIPG